MTEIIKIEDSFILPGKGAVISGVNPLLDCEDSKHIKALVGHRVRIADVNGIDVIF